MITQEIHMLRLSPVGVTALMVWLLLLVLSPLFKTLAITVGLLAAALDGIAQVSSTGRTRIRFTLATRTNVPAPSR